MKNRNDRRCWIPCLMIMGLLISCGGGSSSTSPSGNDQLQQPDNEPLQQPMEPVEKNYTADELAMIQRGQSIYEAQCQSCHGEKGEGGTGGALTHTYELHKLVEKIAASMPTFGEKCTDICASNVGFWIFEGFKNSFGVA